MGSLIAALEADGLLEAAHNDFHKKQLIINAAFLHDIGKVAMPDNILNKRGLLSSEEFRVIQSHTWQGAKIASQLAPICGSAYARQLEEICMYHHERWDGCGYPSGLAGKEIPYAARLMAIVDVYDALTHDRPYKPAYPQQLSLSIIADGCGTQFDPMIARVFIAHAKELAPCQL